jgi:membrane protease YdiL (CAAX protease family)
MENGRQPPTPDAEHARFRVGAFLMLLALFAWLAKVPYLAEILGRKGKVVSLWELAPAVVAEGLILSAIAIWIGLILGPKVDLGAPRMSDWLSGVPRAGRRLRLLLVPSLIGGLAVGVAVAVLGTWLDNTPMPELPESARRAQEVAEQMAAWKLLLASFSAGVTEELLFRLGLMTLFVWLVAKTCRLRSPGAWVFWAANFMAALLFGLAHLTNVAELDIPMTYGTVLYVLLVNGMGGIVLGWLYWRRGLDTAVLAHFVADSVLTVALPMVKLVFLKNL